MVTVENIRRLKEKIEMKTVAKGKIFFFIWNQKVMLINYKNADEERKKKGCSNIKWKKKKHTKRENRQNYLRKLTKIFFRDKKKKQTIENKNKTVKLKENR